MNEDDHRRLGILNDHSLSPYWKELRSIFSLMDAAYEKAASHYGFICQGCEENCCLTRFYHHTYLEVFYLKKAFEALGEKFRKEALATAKRVIQLHAFAEQKGEKVRVMCPLNFGGRCVVYESRPMICRLHGIASELNPPGRPDSAGPVITPGCDFFTRRAEGMNYYTFDRTPFYMKLAALEKQFKQHTGLRQKIKMTVAQILMF